MTRPARFGRIHGLLALGPAALLALLALAPATGCKDDTREVFPTGDPPAGFDDVPCETTKCSDDGLSLVDCSGKEVACGQGNSCLNGKCLPACDVAKTQQSTIGCEYYPVIPSAPTPALGSCYAVMIANVSKAPVALDLSWGDQKISQSYIRKPRGNGVSLSYELLTEGQLGVGEIAIAFLSGRKPSNVPTDDWPGTACPAEVGAAITTADPWVVTGGRSHAFHLTSTGPITVYDIYPYGGAASYYPSSSLLLPTSAWGKNFVAVDGYATSPLLATQGMFPYMQIVASEDDTTVSLLPTTTLGGGPGLADAPVNAPYTTKLARGEYLQFSQKDELNGTIVESDKPVAVVGGSQCANVPVDKVACDTLHQQIPDIGLLGSSYVATRYRDRRSDNSTNLEIVPWRIVGIVDGTELRYDPDIANAPKTIRRGEVVEFNAPGPFTIDSQDKDHPIYVAGYMTGGELAMYHSGTSGNAVSGWGDPEFVNVVPSAQYLSNYVFLTDPTFGNTNLVFVREAKTDAKEVMLDCLGAVTGWQKVGSSGYETARVDLVARGANVGECSNGPHRAWSDASFGLTIWGFDDYASYGYNAGMSAKAINNVSIPVPH